MPVSPRRPRTRHPRTIRGCGGGPGRRLNRTRRTAARPALQGLTVSPPALCRRCRLPAPPRCPSETILVTPSALNCTKASLRSKISGGPWKITPVTGAKPFRFKDDCAGLAPPLHCRFAALQAATESPGLRTQAFWRFRSIRFSSGRGRGAARKDQPAGGHHLVPRPRSGGGISSACRPMACRDASWLSARIALPGPKIV